MSMITLPFEDTAMATSVVHSSVCFVVFFSMVALIPTSSGQYSSTSGSGYSYPASTSGTSLTPDYYKSTCPKIFDIVRDIVQKAINCDRRMGASLLRLHFHDCWVNGCDGSVLLVNIGNFVGEQSAIPNINSLRGFDVVAAIKSALNEKCPCGNVVSCADILAIAASQSVEILGGPRYQVLLGRDDSLTASEAAANAVLPSPFSNITELIANFAAKGLGLKELVPLSGAHTIGRARCGTFKSHLTDSDINPAFAEGLNNSCTANAAAGGNFTVPLDNTTTVFDTVYYQMLTQKMGLLRSDQELYNGSNKASAELVTSYSSNQGAFWGDFASAIIKMGNLPPSSPNGEIRCNCSIPNDDTYFPNSLLKDLNLPSFCPLTLFTCPRSPLVSLSSLFNIGTPPTYCSSPVTSSPSPSPSPSPGSTSPPPYTGAGYPPPPNY